VPRPKKKKLSAQTRAKRNKPIDAELAKAKISQLRAQRRDREVEKMETQALSAPNSRRVKRRNEVRNALWLPQMRMDADTAEILTLAALQRRVSRTVLISDILSLWVSTCVDTRQALFVEALGPVVRPAPVPERWAGYLASLGFMEPEEEQIPPDDPYAYEETPSSQPPAHEYPASVPAYVPRASDPPIHPSPWAQATAPPPAPPDAPAPPPGSVRTPPPLPPAEVRAIVQLGGPSVGRFDPEEYNRVARAPGQGNAAQAVELGFDPNEFGE
jgi:hypothetical protein